MILSSSNDSVLHIGPLYIPVLQVDQVFINFIIVSIIVIIFVIANFMIFNIISITIQKCFTNANTQFVILFTLFSVQRPFNRRRYLGVANLNLSLLVWGVWTESVKSLQVIQVLNTEVFKVNSLLSQENG